MSISVSGTSQAYAYQNTHQRQFELKVFNAPDNDPHNPFGPNRSGDGLITSAIYTGLTARHSARMIIPKNDQSSITKALAMTKGKLYMQHAGIGAAVYGGMSAMKQTMHVMKGEQSAKGAVANVLTDTLRGGAAGVGATAAATMTAGAMKAIGMTGTFGIVASVIGGMVGGHIGSGLVSVSGLRSTLLNAFGESQPA